MDIRKALRQMRLPREIYYKFQLKRQLAVLPKELLKNNAECEIRKESKHSNRKSKSWSDNYLHLPKTKISADPN